METRTLVEYPGILVREDGVILTEDGKELKAVLQGPNRMPSVLVHKAFKGGKGYYNVHRLVALAFLGDPPTKHSKVRHKDGNVMNAHHTNLEYVQRYRAERTDKIVKMICTGYTVGEIVKTVDVQRHYVIDLYWRNKGEIDKWREKNGLAERRVRYINGREEFYTLDGDDVIGYEEK